MNWLLSALGLGGLAGWMFGMWQRERAKSAQEHAATWRDTSVRSTAECARLDDVLKLRDARIKVLEGEIDALDNPASVRARLQRLLTPPTPPAGVPGPATPGGGGSGGAGGVP